MNLTTTEKYALAVLEARGKLSGLQREEQALYLAASCIWDMMQAGAVTMDGKGNLRVSAPLPKTISYCGPVYEWLKKKPMKQEKAALKYISALTKKRTRALVERIADNLIDKSQFIDHIKNRGAAAVTQLPHPGFSRVHIDRVDFYCF